MESQYDNVDNFSQVFKEAAEENILHTDIYRCKKCFTLLSHDIIRNKKDILLIQQTCSICKSDPITMTPFQLFDFKGYQFLVNEKKGASLLTDEVLSLSPKGLLNKWLEYIEKDKLTYYPLHSERQCKTHNLNIDHICVDCNINICTKCLIEQHAEHKQKYSINEYIDRLGLAKKINNFDFLFNISLEQNLAIFNEVTDYFSKYKEYLIQEKEPEEKKVKIEQLIKNLREAYKKNEMENRCLSVLFKLMADFYVKFLYSDISCIVLSNLKNFTRYFLPKITIPNINEDCKVIEDANKVFQYTKFVLEHNLLMNSKDTDINIDILKSTYVFEPTLMIKNFSLGTTRIYGKGHTVMIKCILLYKPDHFLVSSSHSTIKYFKINEHKEIHPITKFKKHSKQVNYLSKGIDWFFYSCSDDRKVIKWKMSDQPIKKNLVMPLHKKWVLHEHKAEVIQVITLDKLKIASCSLDGTIQIYQDFLEEKAPQLLNSMSLANKDSSYIAMVSAGNKIIITAMNNKTLLFWDYQEYKQMDNKTINDVECSSNESMKLMGKGFLIVGGKGVVTIVDLMAYQVLYKCKSNFFGDIASVEILNGKSFICADEEYLYELVHRNEALHIVCRVNHLSKCKIGSIITNGDGYILLGDYKSQIKEFTYVFRGQQGLMYN